MAPSPDHRWRSPLLGDAADLVLPQGRLQYFRRGNGPVLVFAHGWLANANLWRNVVDALADRFTCITLDLPFGSHRVPLDSAADLTPDGCGRLIAGAIRALALPDVVLVGNDSGGAYSQIAVAGDPGLVAGLVLTSCETPFDPFPPPPFEGLPQVAADGAGLRRLFAALRDPAVRRLPGAYGLLGKRPIDGRASDTYALPCLEDDGVLHDARKVIASASAAPVHAAGRRWIEAGALRVLFVWSAEDPVFPFANAGRYAAALARSTFVAIDDCYSFTPEDQPRRLADAIAAFAG
jgi:pimeloyl-ACP methyl ester carboxylesterase